jgi:starvation-inducible DNA-binding protein
MTQKNSPLLAELNLLLADYQVFYQKLRTYHWTVTGPHFLALHAQFEAMYTDVALKADAVAERVLMLGGRPVTTLAEALRLARLKEDGEPRAAEAMIRHVLGDLESLAKVQRALSGKAGELGDQSTVNLLDGFVDEQEKTAWMLRATIAV